MQHHQIQHSEIIDGLKYEIIHEDHQQKAVDFFFEVFLKAQCSTNRKKIAISSIHLWKRFTFAEKRKLSQNIETDIRGYYNIRYYSKLHIFSLYFRTLLWKDEPTSKSFGGYSSRNPAIVDQVECIIKDGVSIMVSDRLGKLVGIRLSHTITR